MRGTQAFAGMMLIGLVVGLNMGLVWPGSVVGDIRALYRRRCEAAVDPERAIVARAFGNRATPTCCD